MKSTYIVLGLGLLLAFSVEEAASPEILSKYDKLLLDNPQLTAAGIKVTWSIRDVSVFRPYEVHWSESDDQSFRLFKNINQT